MLERAAGNAGVEVFDHDEAFTSKVCGSCGACHTSLGKNKVRLFL